MNKTMAKLTVYFENPFWVGLYERSEQGKYEVAKIIFGAEPKDGEICDFLCQNWTQLSFSPSIQHSMSTSPRINPKRMQRCINKEIHEGIGTKAQQALQLQREQRKKERKIFSKEQREAEKQRQFALRQEKRKEKHKGH